MKKFPMVGWAVVFGLCSCISSAIVKADGPSFTKLVPVPAPKIVSSAEEYPGGAFTPRNLLDGNPDTAFASASKGTDTFVEFDFGAPVRVGGFEHVDRNDAATVGESKLTFLDADGKEVGAITVQHVNKRAGTTLLAWPRAIEARRVRWQVTKLGSPYGTVGGSEIRFFKEGGQAEATPAGIGIAARAVPILDRRPEGLVQPLEIVLDHPYAQPAHVVLRVEGLAPETLDLTFGKRTIRHDIPATDAARSLNGAIDYEGKAVVTRKTELGPAKKLTVYILPHSHNDIGYTEIQTEIEDKQVNNLLRGIEYARKTADYPPGARFVWNVEVMWGADLYMRRLSQPQRELFRDALKKGQVALCGMYLNELTGLCRPEELMRLFRYAAHLREETGATIDSAMISDVPGYIWGTVPAMAQGGIKYFSVAPNYSDRIGDILRKWENKPFYWVGPSGKDKVLVWVPFKGYAMSHIYRVLTPDFVETYIAQLEGMKYPYDIAYMRWSGHGDNAAPDPAICDFVKDWSAQHEWPKFLISSTSEAFRAFEQRHGSEIPQVRGDWTPYWEDGAASSALETAMNRSSSDRLEQAESIWAMLNRRAYPAVDFEAAYRNVLLYSEHTWGAYCSVNEPSRRETLEQWAIKASYAQTADLQSRDLLSRAIGQGQQAADAGAIDVINSTSWPRTDLAVVPKYLSEQRSRALDDHGKPVPSQRLRGGELVFLARDVPALAARRYTLVEDKPHVEGKVNAQANHIENDLVSLDLDEKTGGIVNMRAKGIDANLADTGTGHALNDYLYLIGDKLEDLQTNGPVKITVNEAGPLVASLLVTSDAPGCQSLRREVRLVAGLDRVELTNLVDKKRLEAPNYNAKEGKESVNFAFPFHVPDGQLRVEVPYGVVCPDADQIPSACKNWFSANRWADVSNADFGVTWVTLDAPLVEVGGITATLLGSQTNPDNWRKQVGPTQQLYSWAMNNHWHTNYRAYQEGPVTFRYALRPHHQYDAAEASRLAIGLSQPLIVTGARGEKPRSTPRLTVSSPSVLVTAIKPSDDGKAIIVRLWEATGKDVSTALTWADPVPKSVSLSNLGEKPGTPRDGPVTIPAWGVVTLRAELSE